MTGYIPPYSPSLPDWQRQVSAEFNNLVADVASSAPVNLAPNSQWEVMSGLTYGTRWNDLGTGTLPTVAMTSNTTGSNACVLTMGAVPAGYLVGHLVKLSGGTTDASLTAAPMRIQALTGTTITVNLPSNVAPAVSGTSTIQPVNIGGVASGGTGDAADGWKKTTATYVWREDNAVNIPAGATYSLGVNKTTSGQESVYTDITRLKGQTVAFGINVYQKVQGGTGTWQLFINTDGTGGGLTTASPSVGQWLEVSAAIPADATFAQAGVYFNGASGDTYYIANPVVAIGRRAPNYVKPREQFIPIVKIEPWINRSFTFPAAGAIAGLGYFFPVDFHADSGGQIAKTVRAVYGNIEGINTNAVVTGIGGSRIIGFSDKSVDPIKLGTFLPQYVANVKSFGAFRAVLDTSGNCICISPVASDSWGNSSIDIDVLHLE